MKRTLCRALAVSLVLPAAGAAAQAGAAVVLEEVAVEVAGVTIKVPKGWTDLTPSFAKENQRAYEHPPTRIITSVTRRSETAEGLDWALAESKRVFRRDAVEKAEVSPGRYQLVLAPVSGEQSVLVYERSGKGHVRALCTGPQPRLATLREICASMKAR